MTPQRYGEGFFPLIKRWHFVAVLLFWLFASTVSALGWRLYSPQSQSFFLATLGVLAVLALVDPIRGQLYLIALSNQKIVVKLTQFELAG